jgi:hypothetical protein
MAFTHISVKYLLYLFLPIVSIVAGLIFNVRRKRGKAMSNYLRIHGDNILECERALFLIADAFSATIELLPSPPYFPLIRIG